MYEPSIRRMLRNTGSKNAGPRQWRRFFDDRRGRLVYQLKWLATDGQWVYEERSWHRYEVLKEPGVRNRIAISVRIMRGRLVRRTTTGATT